MNQSIQWKKKKDCGMIKRMVNLVVLLLIMSGGAVGQKPDRTSPPSLGNPGTLSLPAIQKFKLSNGLPVVLMEKRGVPVVQINVLVKTGSAMEPTDKSGVASMTAAMLDEGAGTHSALELADAIDFLGARITTSSGQHTSAIALHTPVSKLDAALALMGDIAIRPTFPAEELDRLRKERMTTLVQWHDQPGTIASVAFSQTLYGSRHPYGVPSIGNEQSLRAMKATDLKRFHEANYNPNNVTLIVVGDVRKSDILKKLESVFGVWKGRTTGSVNWPDAAQVERRIIYLIDKPDAAQSEIRIGRIGVSRMTEDYFPLVVMNTILGGSFTSRLNQNLRETHGYSYGAGSFFDMRPLPGPFMAYSAVQTNVTDSALAEFFKEFRNMQKSLPDEEFEKAKNYIALGYPDNFESVSQIAGMLAEMITFNLPDNYFNTYVNKVLAVKKADVERVAREYVLQDKMAVIVVGDRAVIEKGIRGLNLGTVQVRSIEDILGKPPKL
ncbi:MAG: pitrilysin family protein [Bacteroidota bacterium]